MYPEILIYIFSLIFLIYVLFLLIFNIGLVRIKKTSKDYSDKGVTVVIPARNEEDNINECLSCLVNQNYDFTKLEILVIDDRSEDRTGEIIDSFSENYDFIKKIRISNLEADVSPKKNAVNAAVKNSKYDVILLTDADCRPPVNWVRAMISFYENKTGVVLGYSPVIYMGKNKILKKFLYMDSLSLAVISAGSNNAGLPVTCTGRNFSYKKEVFEEVGGYGDLIKVRSGDDDLLLHRIKRNTDWEIAYSASENTINPSHVSMDFKTFVQQRIRHASKQVYYPFYLTFYSVIVYLFNLFVVLFPAACLFKPELFQFYFMVLILKLISEFMFLNFGCKKLEAKMDIPDFIVSFVLHPLYVVVLGFLGLFSKYSWKE